MMDNILGHVLVAVLLGMITGCAATSTTNNALNDSKAAVGSIADLSPAPMNADLTGDFSRSKLIAADFVATIAQIPATAPGKTTLYADEPTTHFGELLLGSLEKAGFDLRIGSGASDFSLAYNAVRDEQLSADGNPVYTFIISAGEVKLKRSYEVDHYGVRPKGGMFVRGASVKNVVSDDSMFSISRPKPEPENGLDPPIRKPEPIPGRPQPEIKSAPTIANTDLNHSGTERLAEKDDSEWQYEKSNKLLTADEKLKLEQARELEETVAALAPARDLANSIDDDNSEAYAEVPNIYKTGRSRYQDILKDYELVEKSVLVFPDDSLILGRANKNAIRQYAAAFNAQTDVMSVIGCSHGVSSLENGNAYLANGRAFRVKEEFVAVGLAPKQVLEEGCWAEVAFPEMPARGVLVQHKRLADN